MALFRRILFTALLSASALTPAALVSPAQAQALPEKSPDTEAEVIYWQLIVNSTVPEDYEAYLKKYPHGQFVDLAKSRLFNLDKQGPSS